MQSLTFPVHFKTPFTMWGVSGSAFHLSSSVFFQGNKSAAHLNVLDLMDGHDSLSPSVCVQTVEGLIEPFCTADSPLGEKQHTSNQRFPSWAEGAAPPWLCFWNIWGFALPLHGRLGKVTFSFAVETEALTFRPQVTGLTRSWPRIVTETWA